MWRKIFPVVTATLVAVAGLAQTVIKKTPVSSTTASDGAGMYAAYCASCHGAGGKGDGPAAAALKAPMPDLTRLSADNGGAFPAQAVMYTLGVMRGGGAHGSSDMPVWGDLFRASGQADYIVQMRTYNMTRFLEAIQEPVEKPAAAKKVRTLYPHQISPVSAASMYRSFCAGCHGIVGRGDGPAAAALKPGNLDLTQLTARHGGKFPATHVMETLGQMPGSTSAHGSKEMPVWGDIFRDSREPTPVVQLRLHNLTEYLKSIQQ